MSSIIEVRNLVKKYKKSNENSVDGISFSVQEGEFFSLLGPNGAGKTTTISVLTTTLSKTSGSVHIAGFDLDSHEREVRKKIGVIFQNQSLDKNLTGEENIRFHASLYGLFPFRPLYALMTQKYKERVGELAGIVGLERDIFNPITAYSGGMKRKLEIVRGLMHNPRVLFLDEPTTGLDPLSRKNVWNYLQDVRKKEKTTIFLTTHYLEEAENADHVCIIDHGRIVAYGTPRDVSKDKSLEEAYLEIITKEYARV